MAVAFNAPLAREEVFKLNRALLARETGWTYDEIDRLDFTEVIETLHIYEAVDRARAWIQRRGAPTATATRRARR